MTNEYTDEQLKQLLHDAIWEELPETGRTDLLEVNDIRISQSDDVPYEMALVKNNLLGRLGSDWIETNVGKDTVRYRIGETAGINDDEVWFEVY